MPFGDGPRMCMGNRFALLELKVSLAIIYYNYTFRLSKEKNQVPLEMDTWVSVSPKAGPFVCPMKREH